MTNWTGSRRSRFNVTALAGCLQPVSCWLRLPTLLALPLVLPPSIAGAQMPSGAEVPVLGSSSPTTPPANVALPTLDVQGSEGGGGFVANEGPTATKTDTPLIETPQSVSIVTREQIERQALPSLGAALRYMPGVQGETTGASDTRYGGLYIRGFDSTGRVFYRDGLRLPSTSTADFQTIDPYGAERIEVLRGPASVLFGQNGPGGLINYVSKRPTTEAFREVSISGGSFGRFQGAFDLGGSLTEDGAWSYRLTGLGRQGDSQVDTVRDDRIFIAPALTWRPDADTTITLSGHYQRDRAGWGLQFFPALGTVRENAGRRIPRSRFLGERDFDYYDSDQASAGYLFERRITEGFTVRQNLRYSYLANDQASVYGAGYVDAESGLLARAAGTGRSRLHSFAVDNQAQVNFATGPLAHTMLAGLDYRWTRYDDRLGNYETDSLNVFAPVYGSPIRFTGIGSDSRTSQNQLGLYVQDQIRLGRLSLILGGRNDWADTESADRLAGTTVRRSASAFTGRAGLIYNFANGLAPYVTYSESFLPVLDRDANGRLLEPETGRQYEVGVKYQPPGWNALFSAAAFNIQRDKVVRFDAVGSTFAARQTGQITSQGIELESVASLTSRLNLRASYTYLDVEITKDPDGGNQGKRPSIVPRHTAALWADYTLRDAGLLSGMGFGGGVRYVASSFGDDANTFKVPDATVFDAALRCERSNLQLAVNVSNLFDRSYVASCFNADFGCFFGEGRRVTTRATMRW